MEDSSYVCGWRHVDIAISVGVIFGYDKLKKKIKQRKKNP
jgi:hypothetical protein